MSRIDCNKMKLEQKQIKNVLQATLLSIIPGLGQ
ncbi:hypothetical protein MUX59_14845, partial [Listeria monocytogenes]|nr:hypothetical protein [Listeria monocytogenes]